MEENTDISGSQISAEATDGTNILCVQQMDTDSEEEGSSVAPHLSSSIVVANSENLQSKKQNNDCAEVRYPNDSQLRYHFGLKHKYRLIAWKDQRSANATKESQISEQNAKNRSESMHTTETSNNGTAHIALSSCQDFGGYRAQNLNMDEQQEPSFGSNRISYKETLRTKRNTGMLAVSKRLPSLIVDVRPILPHILLQKNDITNVTDSKKKENKSKTNCKIESSPYSRDKYYAPSFGMFTSENQRYVLGADVHPPVLESKVHKRAKTMLADKERPAKKREIASLVFNSIKSPVETSSTTSKASQGSSRLKNRISKNVSGRKVGKSRATIPQHDKYFRPHSERNRFVECNICDAEIWPPNREKHLVKFHGFQPPEKMKKEKP